MQFPAPAGQVSLVVRPAENELSLGRETGLRLPAPFTFVMPTMTTRAVFCYDTHPFDRDAGATADALRERLRAACIPWEEVGASRDCERIVENPDSPGGWAVELDSVGSTELLVAEADWRRADAILAELTGRPAPPLAPSFEEAGRRLLALEDEARRVRRRDELQAMRLYDECERGYRERGDKAGLLRVLKEVEFLLDGVSGMEAAAEGVREEYERLERELETERSPTPLP